MATQNAAARSAFAAPSPTTVMTGNVTQATMDSWTCCCAPATTCDPGPHRKMAPPIVAFAAGALGAGVLAVHVGFACLLVPVALLALLAGRV